MSFMLDYEKTFEVMRANWKYLKAYPELYKDAFQDTFADYIELRDSIPPAISHVAWFRMRMWNNINKYEPFKQRLWDNLGYFTPSFTEYDEDLEGGGYGSPEDAMVLAETTRECYADKWGIPVDTTSYIGNLFLEGYNRKEVQEILSDGSGKDKMFTIRTELNRLREERNEQEQSEGGGGPRS